MWEPEIDEALQPLAQQFPYLFAGEHIGLCLPDGWVPRFGRLCEEIDAMLTPEQRRPEFVHFAQLKEKFGTARIYLEGGFIERGFLTVWENGQLVADTHAKDETLQSRLQRACRRTEADTAMLCAYCGKAATIDGSAGYILALCDEHRAALRERSRRLDEGEDS